MKILVAGGLGFIGSKVIEKLCDEHSVTAFDSKETYDVLTKEEHKKLVEWRTRNWKNVSVIEGDISDRLTCLKAFSLSLIHI